MNQLNFSGGVYLDSQELIKSDYFSKQVLDSIINKKIGSYGILTKISAGVIDSNSMKVERGTNFDSFGNWTVKCESGEAIIANPFQSTMNLPGKLYNSVYVKVAQQDNIAIESGGSFASEAERKVVIRPTLSYYEDGLVSIAANGQITGTGTFFTRYLRGHNSVAPTKVKFIKQDGSAAVNNSIYEISSVVDDTNAQMIGAFTAESNIRLIVVGSYELSEQSSLTSRTMYSYIKGELKALLAASVESSDILLATIISNGDGTFTITDERSDSIFTLNTERSDKEWAELTGFTCSANIENRAGNHPTVKVREVGDGTIEVMCRFKLFLYDGIATITGFSDETIEYIGQIFTDYQPETTKRKAMFNCTLDDLAPAFPVDPKITAGFEITGSDEPGLMIHINIPESSVTEGFAGDNVWYVVYMKQSLGGV